MVNDVAGVAVVTMVVTSHYGQCGVGDGGALGFFKAASLKADRKKTDTRLTEE